MKNMAPNRNELGVSNVKQLENTWEKTEEN